MSNLNWQEIPPGTVFGKLTVIENVGHKPELVSKINYYKCACECGAVKDIRRNHLLAGKTISCGCHRRTINSKAPGDISFNSLYNVCKHGAKDRNLIFDLTKEQHKEIVIKNCHYCDNPPQYYNVSLKRDGSVRATHIPVEKERAAIYANGVDRVDSSKGYALVNCVPCCTDCNRSKWEMTPEQYVAHCRKVVEHHDKKAAACPN